MGRDLYNGVEKQSFAYGMLEKLGWSFGGAIGKRAREEDASPTKLLDEIHWSHRREERAGLGMDEMVCKLVDYLGACERIFRSPIPLV